VLLFLHADSELPSNGVALIDAAVDSGARAGFFRLQLDSPRLVLRLVGWLITQRSRLTSIATGDQGLFVTRSAFAELGGFAPLPLFEDVEWSARVRRCGRSVCLDGTVVTSARRWEVLGPLRTIVRMWLLRAAYAIGVPAHTLAHYYQAVR
jgi:hypothetical protein